MGTMLPVPLYSDIQRFLTYLSATGSNSPHTLRAYESDLKSFADFLGQRCNRPADTAMVTLENARFWLGQMFGSCQKRTMARRISALRSFSRWLSSSHGDSFDEMDQLGIPR
ncbi:site-specific integrase, partial [Myxococcota bacterium]|nr:site-specific integrase [Myxococcota bacterium]